MTRGIHLEKAYEMSRLGSIYEEDLRA